MKPGDLVGFETEGAFAEAIRFGQHRRMHLRNWEVTHIGIIESVYADGGVNIIQAVRHVDRVSLASYGATPHVVIPFPGADGRRGDVVRFVQHELGQDYGVLSVVSRAIDCNTPDWLQVHVDRKGHMDCSTLAARAWEHGGVCGPWGSPYEVVPGQLADWYPTEAA